MILNLTFWLESVGEVTLKKNHAVCPFVLLSILITRSYYTGLT